MEGMGANPSDQSELEDSASGRLGLQLAERSVFLDPEAEDLAPSLVVESVGEFLDPDA